MGPRWMRLLIGIEFEAYSKPIAVLVIVELTII